MTPNALIIVLAIAGGLLPALLWLWFWLREDRAHPEPKILIVTTFLLGALSIIPVYFIEQTVASFSGFTLTGQNWLNLILLWAFIEEGVKYLVARISVFRTSSFDEPIDAMIYLITIALGFAAAENALFMMSAFLGSGADAGAFWLTGNLRFIGATLIHVVSSAVVGSSIAIGFCHPAKRREQLVLGLVTATLLHSLFNYFILVTNDENILKIFIFIWSGAILTLLFFERAKKIVCQPTLTNQ